MSDSHPAKYHAQRLLDQTGRGLILGDFDLFADCFRFPQVIQTFEGMRYVETREDMRYVFHQVRKHFEKMGVTDAVRHVVTSTYRDENTISTIHQSRLISGYTLVQKPYNVLSTIERVDGVWLVAESQYAVDDSPSLCRALVGENRTVETVPTDGSASSLTKSA